MADIDDMTSSFLSNNNDTIKTLCNRYYSDKSFPAFVEMIQPIIRNACITFVNNNYQSEQLKPYLISVILNSLKEKSDKNKLQASYICPACSFFKEETIIYLKKVFTCNKCTTKLSNTTDPKEIKLFGTYATHNKKGYRCTDCDRFIPQPINGSSKIICPFYDCCFVGPASELKTMRHPVILVPTKTLSLDSEVKESLKLKEVIASSNIASDSELEIKEEIQNNFSLLKDVIQSQINSLYYTSNNSTLIHKICMYQAFSNMIDYHPNEMISYLVLMKSHSGLQHKIFQEYVKILESKLPFVVRKNGKIHRISSLLDESLCLFDGISIFESVITDKNDIKNCTEEFYIGGRKGTYSKPYYIGKLLDVIDVNSSQSLLSKVKEYSFSKIKLKNVIPGTKVKVSHLRIPPHYQMGGMVYLNRIRRKIVDKVYLTKNGTKREISHAASEENIS